MSSPSLDARRLHRIAWLALLLQTSSACSPGEKPAVSEEAIRHNVLGCAYLGQLKWTEAEAQFRKALALRPEDPLLLTNTAIALVQRNETDAARALLDKAQSVDPDYAPAHFHLGLIATREGDFERAVREFEAVARVDPDELFTQYYLGTSYVRIGREEQAIAALRSALARDPTHVSTLYALGRLLLQRGAQEEGLGLIQRSQEVRRRSGLDEPVGGEYGEQGPYSLGRDYPGGLLAAPKPIPVTFTASAEAELGAARAGMPFTLLPGDTAGAPTLVVARGNTLVRPFAPEQAPRLPSLGGEREIVALEAADVDDDGLVDLVLLSAPASAGEAGLEPAIVRQRKDGWSSADPAAFSGDPRTSGPSAAGLDLAAADRDHDGDLDLLWCWTTTAGGGCRLATNDGSGRFEVTPAAQHGFGIDRAASGRVSVAFSDVDNDRDIDLLVAEPAGLHLFTNQRDGNFAEISESAGLASGSGGVYALAVADIDKDGFMDLVTARKEGVVGHFNRDGRFEPPVPLAPSTEPLEERSGLVVLDYDNDGFLDVACGSDEERHLRHNRGGGEWSEGPLLAGSPWAAWDADGDGDADLALGRAGKLTLARNDGGNANGWIRLVSRGVNDNRFGIGTKVEVLAGALRQKFELDRPLPLLVGVGQRSSIEAVRSLWPGGVLQDELEVKPGTEVEIAQLDRKGTSCPLLYAWDGRAWRFVTDFLGGSAIGYQHAPGVFGEPDTDEYVRIEGGVGTDAEGRPRLRVNNQLEEVIWFDQIELVVVDHPSGTEVYPDERLMPGPPYPAFRLFASSDIRPLASARDVEDGADLSGALRELDRRYAQGFERLRPKGYASLHAIELDAGPLPASSRIVLLLDGWIDYADSSANVAAAQSGLSLVPPRLSVADGRGGWRQLGSIGFPAGLPKPMTVDLTGSFPTADHRLRIETSMRIHWDRARILVGGDEIALRVLRFPPVAADLRYGGFPRETSPDGRPPFGYDPSDVASTAPWKAHVGAYTAFGDVAGALASIDDRFVTTRNGDEIDLRFPALEPPAEGSTRTYLLFADGFGKDMDPNSAAGDTVAPVPFHGMPTYPYGAEVHPPTSDSPPERRSRHVLPSPAGWPGALPLPLAREADDR